MSATYLIPGITRIPNTDACNYCQHCCTFLAFRVLSIRMHLNTVSIVSHLFLALRIFHIQMHLPTSTSFLISGITSIQHINVFEDSQRHFPFSAFKTFSIPCRGEFDISRLTHLVFRLCQHSYAGEFHLSRFTHMILCFCQYFMWERISPIKVQASDSLPLLYLSCPHYFIWGKATPIKKFTHWDPKQVIDFSSKYIKKKLFKVKF